VVLPGLGEGMDDTESHDFLVTNYRNGVHTGRVIRGSGGVNLVSGAMCPGNYKRTSGGSEGELECGWQSRQSDERPLGVPYFNFSSGLA